MGLCEAEMTAPISTLSTLVRYATPGVGMIPASMTSKPPALMPAASALERKSPETRVSRPISARRRPVGCSGRALSLPSTRTAASPRSSASWAVRSRLASPRTPSVPNIRGISSSLMHQTGPAIPCGRTTRARFYCTVRPLRWRAKRRWMQLGPVPSWTAQAPTSVALVTIAFRHSSMSSLSEALKSATILVRCELSTLALIRRRSALSASACEASHLSPSSTSVAGSA